MAIESLTACVFQQQDILSIWILIVQFFVFQTNFQIFPLQFFCLFWNWVHTHITHNWKTEHLRPLPLYKTCVERVIIIPGVASWAYSFAKVFNYKPKWAKTTTMPGKKTHMFYFHSILAHYFKRFTCRSTYSFVMQCMYAFMSRRCMRKCA